MKNVKKKQSYPLDRVSSATSHISEHYSLQSDDLLFQGNSEYIQLQGPLSTTLPVTLDNGMGILYKDSVYNEHEYTKQPNLDNIEELEHLRKISGDRYEWQKLLALLPFQLPVTALAYFWSALKAC